jgi:hypothetical protein
MDLTPKHEIHATASVRERKWAEAFCAHEHGMVRCVAIPEVAKQVVRGAELPVLMAGRWVTAARVRWRGCASWRGDTCVE